MRNGAARIPAAGGAEVESGAESGAVSPPASASPAGTEVYGMEQNCWIAPRACSQSTFKHMIKC